LVEVEERIIKVNEIEIGERIKFKLYLGKYCYKKTKDGVLCPPGEYRRYKGSQV
jgi:hypothetical protein